MTSFKSNALPHDERRSSRSEVRLHATIQAGPGRSLAVTVVNVSAHGIMVECDDQLVPGRPVTIDMAGLVDTSGRVAWLRDGHVGIAFTTPLSLAEIDAIV